MSETYERFLADVDRMVLRLEGRYRSHLTCRAGCADCCQVHVSVFPVEAARLAGAVRELPASTRTVIRRQAAEATSEANASDPCPLLVEDRCAVYAARPVICRTQGLPLLLESGDGSPEVDFCPLNFSAPGATDDLEDAYLVDLETLNRSLAIVNLEFCARAGKSLRESGIRKLIGALILEQTGPDA
jgi:uncharacterized protein